MNVKEGRGSRGPHFEALIARTGVPLPPAQGIKRFDYCTKAAVDTLNASRRRLTDSFLLLCDQSFPTDFNGTYCHSSKTFFKSPPKPTLAQLPSLPPRSNLASSTTGNFEILSDPNFSFKGWAESRRLAEESLFLAVESFLWIKDAIFDMSDEKVEKPIGTGDRPRTSIEDIHNHLHSVGSYYSMNFGCFGKIKSGRLYRTCPVGLAHVNIGVSIGAEGDLSCSICYRAPQECDHIPGEKYKMRTGITPDGFCTGCGVRAGMCHHQAGSLETVECRFVITSATIRETSLVHRPLDPLCRINAIELKTPPGIVEYLSAHPDYLPRLLRCTECLAECNWSAGMVFDSAT